MNIGFSGHRDCITHWDELVRIALVWTPIYWIHGGAKGFDTQVDRFARGWEQQVRVITPDYSSYPPHQRKLAPLARNQIIVDESDLLVACWDGREEGGTWDTIQRAQKKGIEIHHVEAVYLYAR